MRTETQIVVAVALGSALGGLARYGLSGVVARSFGETFPWGTLVVNVVGSFLIGLFATVTGPDGRLLASPVTRQFWMIGIFGGFTTFSSFSLQTLSLAQPCQGSGNWCGRRGAAPFTAGGGRTANASTVASRSRARRRAARSAASPR